MRRARSTAALIALPLLLAGCSSSGMPDASPSASDGAPWTPDSGYVEAAALPGQLTSLVAAPATVKSATVSDVGTGGCITPYAPEVACGEPSVTVELVVVSGAQETTVTVVESVELDRVEGRSRCSPDARVGGIHPTAGYHCEDRLPWTATADRWATTVRAGNDLASCREEAVVRRGRMSVLVREPLASAWCDRAATDLDAVPLTDAQLQTIAAAAPLVTELERYYSAASPAAT